MVRIRSLTIHNFGPYIDEVIEFPERDGVCFVWGENGSGKSTLLNIFKYAFLGTLFDGKYNLRSKVKAKNYHTDDSYFGVTMDFESDGSHYRLVRNQRLKEGISKPIDNSSFKEDLSLMKDGEILSPDETVRTLNQLMPADISQFFFFDSVRLSLFENLMDEDDTSGLGQNVKESIEKILGIPVLKNCVSIMDDINSAYDSRIIKSMSEDKKNKKYEDALKKLTEKLINENDELRRKNETLEDLKALQSSLTEKMKENQKAIKNLERKKSLEEQLNAAKERLGELEAEMRGPVSEVWRSMLVAPMKEIDAAISERYRELEAKVSVSILLEKLGETDECPLCGAKFDPECTQLKFSFASEKEKEEYHRLTDIKMKFAANTREDRMDLVRRIERDINQTTNNIHVLKADIRDCEDQLSLTTQETLDIEDLQKRYRICIGQISECQAAIADLQERIREDTEQKEKITQNVKFHSSGESARLVARQELYKKLKGVFELSIDHYCQSMRTKVEKDASDFFMKVDKSGFYSGLKINENYGLELIDNLGKVVPVPSTGYQHMIALSLIRGIHKNAPIEGPAIVDYLFAHIDENHKPLVARATPYLSDQVMVLAFKGEYDQEELRNVLLGDLIREYRLIREEAYSTKITIQ